MKAILRFATLLGLAAAINVYGVQQTGPATENGDQAAVQERERSLDRTCVLTQAEHHATAQERQGAPESETPNVLPSTPTPTPPEQMREMRPGMRPMSDMPCGGGNCPNGPNPMHEGMHQDMHNPAMHHSMHHR
jgi:hypothetical protein